MCSPKPRGAGWLTALVALTGVMAASAAEPPHAADAAALWRELTRLDVETTYTLLKENHPGAAPEAGDPRFVAALEAAHTRALDRAAHVSSLEGHTATLGEMTNSMGDPHLGVSEHHAPREVRWAGIIAGRQADHWVVALSEPKIVGAELKGARILSCDGRPIDELARDTLHYISPLETPAAFAMAAVWLLIDQGNPFLTAPKSCVLEHNGQKRTLDLAWQPISRAELLEHHWPDTMGQAGFGVRASGPGYWVGIEELEGRKAQAVVDDATKQAAQLRAAAYVVVDVRGNGGGSDHYMRELADALYGKPYVDAILGPENTAGPCQEVFRASPDNIQVMSDLVEPLRKSGDTFEADALVVFLQKMRTALAAGKGLTGPATCPAWKPPKKVPASLIHAKVFILSDVACFSSCINGVQFFRQLGATQIGQPTRADTHYGEIRQIALPSGLSDVGTMLALQPSYPATIGPFNPVIGYDGDITDTAALERWVRELASAP